MQCRTTVIAATMLTTALGGGALGSTLGEYYDVTTLFVAEQGYGGGGSDVEYYGIIDETTGWAVGTTSCNLGNIEAPWYGGTNNVPVIAQNMYRYEHGRLEQIATCWLKHSFCAVSEPGCHSSDQCIDTPCSTLGIGCADTYWADLNADADAPRSEINATTGEYDYPFTLSPSGPSVIRGKLQLQLEDIDPELNEGALYFVEGQYVVPGEWAFGTHLNNASARQLRFNSVTQAFAFGGTHPQRAAIKAWEIIDPQATVLDILTLEDGSTGSGETTNGLLHLGFSTTQNADGTWHYEFALHNQASHRSVGSFEIPVPDCVTITNVEFHGVPWHSGESVESTVWTWERGDGVLSWKTDPFEDNPDANALRWASMINLRFDADAAPTNGDATIGLWRPGPDTGLLDAAVRVPDCEATGCPEDVNGDWVVDVNDLLATLALWGDPAGDVDGDGDCDIDDLLLILSAFGTVC